MNPLLRSVLVVLACSIAFSLSAQSDFVNMTVTTVSVSSGQRIGGDYRYQIFLNNSIRVNCLKINNGTPNVTYDLPGTVVANFSTRLSTPISLQVKAWQENSSFDCNRFSNCGMGDCDYNSGCTCEDNDLVAQTTGEILAGSSAGVGGATFLLSNLRPGNVSDNLITIKYGTAPNYTVTYRIKYTLPTPTAPAFTAYDENNQPYTGAYMLCTTNPITLATSTALNANYISQMQYEWFFNINGEKVTIWEENPAYCGNTFGLCDDVPDPIKPPPSCCYEPQYISRDETVWRAVPGNIVSNPGAASVQMKFNIRDLASDQWNLTSITQTAVVNFAVKVHANSYTSALSASSVALNVAPSRPVIGSNPTSTLSCPNGTGDAAITVSNISGVVGKYKYNLRPGPNNNQPCNPDNENCFTGRQNGPATNNEFTIPQVAAGDYTLWLVNFDTGSGSCATTKNVHVDAYDTLALGVSSVQNVSIHGNNTGQINLNNSGGKAPFTFSLTGQSSNATGQFPGLGANSYTATVGDACGQSIPNVTNSVVTITQPVRISESVFNPSRATCASPGNGEMTATVTRSTGAYDVPVSGTFTYDYKLYKDGSLYDSWESTTASTSKSNLPISGNYQLIVIEKGGMVSNGYSKTFSIAAPDALAINSLNVVDVSCFDGNNGQISFSGTGGSNQYNFKMTRTAGDTIQNSTGSFSGLRSGNYTLIIHNGLAACNDKIAHPSAIPVGQAEKISIGLSKTDVTCYDKRDGTLTATVGGGTPGYTLAWERKIGAAWTSFSNSGLSIDRQQDGIYRLKVTDSKACTDSSTAVTIIEPELLEIDSVGISDIKCFSEKGTISVFPSGGTPNYSFAYSLDGVTYTPFTNTTPLNAGSYSVKAIDNNGCPAIDSGPYVITSPPAMLDFTFVQSDYFGYHISCNGGNNGEIVITPTGGNGGSYTGYEFKKDNGAFQRVAKIENFNAGLHPISVKDNRGCIVTKSVNFTQAAVLSVSTELKKNVDCYGDSTGVIELKIAGGVGPYSYQRGTLPVQTDPTFDKLSSGSYSFSIIDKNKCATQYQDNIVNLYPQISSSALIKDASCFHGKDGSITLTVQGGASTAYSYEQDKFGSTTNPVRNLIAGTYKVKITDNLGCRHEIGNLQVDHPDSLMIEDVKRHDIICSGEKGSIGMTSSGGTTPHYYEYAVKGTFNFTAFSSTTPLIANTYLVRVHDSQYCYTAYTQELAITNPAPLDFTYQLSDYNGFNISCYGGDNGHIVINGSGGNGADYSGYEFAMDNRQYQTESKIELINSGPHDFYIRDARGCVKGNNISFTQSKDQLNVSLKRKQDVNCFYEKNGLIEVAASGGVTPYKYWLSATDKKNDPLFTGLGVGAYNVIIGDVNECANVINTDIKSIHPEFSLSFNIKDVSCFEGTDGSVSLSVSGGVAPFQYRWKDQLSTTSVIENIKSGTYEVTATDNAGCFLTTSANLKQPDAPLRLTSVKTSAACYDQTNGTITIVAQGGTAPYRYWLNSEPIKQDVAVFNRGVGDYTPQVEDINGCVANGAATIQQRNNIPEPNFVVALKEHALDTLVIKELSYPKPDSVFWAFDQNAIVISNDPWSPEILFREQGNYTVTMMAYFGDCGYALTKTLTLSPFDPDAIMVKPSGYEVIESVDVSPNPNTGQFDVAVKLGKKYNVSILVYNVLGIVHYNKAWEKTQEVREAITINDAASGVYLLRVIAETDAKDVRIIVNK